MHPTYTYETTHRPPTDPLLTVPALRTQVALVAVPPLLVWALANPATALLVVAVVAVVAWHRLAARPSPRPGPTRPPD